MESNLHMFYKYSNQETSLYYNLCIKKLWWHILGKVKYKNCMYQRLQLKNNKYRRFSMYQNQHKLYS
jgi:hypothetical protein